MKAFTVTQAVMLLRLSVEDAHGGSLLEQVEPYIPRSRHLLLDVADVQFNSMLLGEVVNVQQAFLAHWGELPCRLALVRVSDFSRRVLSAVRLDERIPVYPSVDAALAELNPPPAPPPSV